MEKDSKTLSPATGISVSLLLGIASLVVPMGLGYVNIRSDLASMRQDIRTIRNNMGDRWSASMMVLWAERLKFANTNITTPSVHQVKTDMPLPDPMP
jgi:hypothetical protein